MSMCNNYYQLMSYFGGLCVSNQTGLIAGVSGSTSFFIKAKIIKKYPAVHNTILQSILNSDALLYVTNVSTLENCIILIYIIFDSNIYYYFGKCAITG